MDSQANSSIWELTKTLELNSKPAADELNTLLKLHGPDLPADYLDFISKHDGADGKLCDNYLSIYTIADVLGVAKVSEDAPDSQFLLVASTGYFHYGVRAGTFYELDMLEDTYQVIMGTGFAEFLQKFKARNWEDE